MKGWRLFGVFLLASADLAYAQDRSDLYDELDIFAAAVLDTLQVRSIAENVEYCGCFGIDATGRLAATKAVRGSEDSCLPDVPPAGFEALASYHTHGAYSLESDSEVPSVDDMLSDLEEGVDGYVATPGGRLWLNIFDEELAVQLCGPGCVTADPNYRPCRAYLPDLEYTLDDLHTREEEDPGIC